MSAVLIRPYLELPGPSVKESPWQYRDPVAGANRELGPEIPGWDYNTDVELSRRIELDGTEIRSHLMLGDDSALGVLLRWQSIQGRSEHLGGVSRPTLIPLGPAVVETRLTVQGRYAGGVLRLETLLVVRNPGLRARPPAPGKSSIVWSDVRKVALEGVGPRFPMSLVDFETEGLSKGAGAWTLRIRPDAGLGAPFLGAVELLVNSRNPLALRAALNPGAGETERAVASVLRIDTARALILWAARAEPELDFEEPYPEDSVGAAARNLIKRCLPGVKDLESLRQCLENDRFERDLQDQLHLLEEG